MFIISLTLTENVKTEFDTIAKKKVINPYLVKYCYLIDSFGLLLTDMKSEITEIFSLQQKYR